MAECAKIYRLLICALVLLSIAPAALAQDASYRQIFLDFPSSDGSLQGGSVTNSNPPLLMSSSPIVANAIVSPVLQNGAPTNRVDIVVLGDGYTAAQTNTFQTHVTELYQKLFLESPLYEYQRYFNVHRVDTVSTQSGIDNDPSQGTAKNTALDMGFWCQGVENLLCANVDKVWQYAGLAPDLDQIIVMANSTKSGGSAYPFSDMALISSKDRQSSLIAHLFGHSFANLADEYDSGNWPTYTGFEPAEPNASVQNSDAMSLQGIKWHRWLGVEAGAQFGGIIGTYEGAMQSRYGIFRPTTDSKMRSLNAPFNLPSVESFILQIYRRVRPIDSATANNGTIPGSTLVEVAPMRPLNRELNVQWYLNNALVAGATGTSFRADTYPLADGTYELKVRVTDDTPWVRNEEERALYMTETKVWTVAVSQSAPLIISQPQDVSVFLGATAEFTVGASGAGLSYQWFKGDSLIHGATNARLSLSSVSFQDSGSEYWVRVTNLKGSAQSRRAKLTVKNRAPSIQAVSNRSMHWRTDSILIPLVGSDPDSQPLTYTAELLTPNVPVSIALQGDTLLVNPSESYLGTFSIKVSVSDGELSASTSFSVQVTNAIPQLGQRAKARVHWRQNLVDFEVTGLDSDGDPLQYSVSLADGSSAPVTLSLVASTVRLTKSVQAFKGVVPFVVTLSDGRSSSSRTYEVEFYNNLPSLEAITSKSMHWRKDFTDYSLQYNDVDADPLTVQVKRLNYLSEPISISVTGNTLRVNPEPNAKLSVPYSVEVSVSDGFPGDEAKQEFSLTLTNGIPRLELPDQINVHWKQGTFTVDIPVLSDPDNDVLSVESSIKASVHFRNLQQQQGLTLLHDSWMYNRHGQGERYLQSKPLGQIHPEWLALWTDGNLYQYDGGLILSTPQQSTVKYFGWLQGAYRDPRLFIETLASESDIPAQIFVDTNTGRLSGTIEPNFKGVVEINVSVDDGIDSASDSTLLAVYNSVPQIQPINDVVMGYKEDSVAFPVSVFESDNELVVNTVALGSFEGRVHDLNALHNFTLRAADYQFNKHGLRERSVQGTLGGVATDYIILSDGRLLKWQGSLDSSAVIATLSPNYYHNPALLFSAEARPPPPLGTTTSLNSGMLNVDPPLGYQGTFPVTIHASDGEGSDTHTVTVHVVNRSPVIAPLSDLTMHWTQDYIEQQVRAIDPDEDPVQVSATVLQESQALALDAIHDFSVPSVGLELNKRGHQEKYLNGKKPGSSQSTSFFILPNGSFYEFLSSIEQSRYIALLPRAYYRNPDLLIDVPPIPSLAPGSITLSGDTLRINPDTRFKGRFLVQVSASDGASTGSDVFLLRAGNNAPQLQKIENQRIIWREDSRTVAIDSTDLDNDAPLSRRAFLGTYADRAAELKRLHSFTQPQASPQLSHNYRGWNEKYLRGVKSGVNTDFVILPGGALYEFKGNLSTMNFLARVPEAYYQNPSLLIGATSTFTPPPVSLTIVDNRLEVNPALGFLGSFLVTVEVDDSRDFNDTQFQVEVVNSAPVFNPGNLTLHWREGTKLFPLVASDADLDPITFRLVSVQPNTVANVKLEGAAVSVTPLARALGTFSIQLSASDGLVTVEKQVSVKVSNTAPIINAISDQTMGWREDKRTLSLSASDLNGDPLSYFASTNDPLPPGTVSVNGNTLTIDPPQSYLGTFTVTYGVDDGNIKVSRTFKMTVANRKPLLDSIPNITKSYRQVPVTVALKGTDLDSDPLTLSANLLPGYAGLASVRVNGTMLEISPQGGYVGDLKILARASDGNLFDEKQFTLTLSNARPTLQAIPTQQLLKSERTRTINLVASDADADPLTYTARINGSNPAGVQVYTYGSQLKVSAPVGFIGTVSCAAEVSDGKLAHAVMFNISVNNQAPIITNYLPRIVTHGIKTVDLPFTATDPDNDTLSFGVTLSGAYAASARAEIVANSIVRVHLLQDFVGGISVNLSVADGATSTARSVILSSTNQSPVLGVIGAQTSHWRTKEHRVSLSASDADNDLLSFSATFHSTLQLQARVENQTLVISWDSAQTGSASVLLSSSDGISASQRSFQFSITNTAPTLDSIADQIMPANTEKNIAVVARDADLDPLTIQAKSVSPQRKVYELDQIHNFELRYGSYFFNRTGNNEKYIQGTQNNPNNVYWYVIYPNGALLQWSGQLTTSTRLAVLPAEYYEDPSKLFNVAEPAAEPAPATVTIVGRTLQLLPRSDFSGAFFVELSASDSVETVSINFTVSVSETSEGGGESCSIKTQLHQGDYSGPLGTSAFSAEGRIGDAATGAGNRTFEVDVAKSTAGPFNPGETANFVWQSKKKVPFRLTYDEENELVEFRVDNTVVQHIPVVEKALTDLLLRARATHASSKIILSTMYLNGTRIKDSLEASGGTRTLQISGATIDEGFLLEGEAQMEFELNGSETPTNSHLAFQISAVSVDGKLSCSATEEPHCEKGRVTVCHSPPGNPAQRRTKSIPCAALDAHLGHGDTMGACPVTDPEESQCSEMSLVESPVFTLWNSFLSMINILELVNPSSSDIQVKISFYSILGELAHQQIVTVLANNQFDVILNQFPGFIVNSYGIVKLEFVGTLDGRMLYYRQAPDSGQYDFVFGFPFSKPSFGTTAVSFNTFQPSSRPSEQQNIVANWLTVVSLDSRPQVFVIKSFTQNGELLLRREVEVPSFGRLDLDGGHDFAGPSVVGAHVITPRDETALYIAQLTRFGGDAPAGYAPSNYRFAFPLIAQAGASEAIYAPVSNKFGEQNWVEVINILDEPVPTVINFYGEDGELLESKDAILAPYAQFHFYASSFVAAGKTGHVQIIPSIPHSLIGQSMFYFLESSGSVTTMYGTQARRGSYCTQNGSYNLFLGEGMQNWLKVSNPSELPVDIRILVHSSNQTNEKLVSIAARGTSILPLHDPALFGLSANSYGQVNVKTNSGSAELFAEILRIKQLTSSVDFATPTVVRR